MQTAAEFHNKPLKPKSARALLDGLQTAKQQPDATFKMDWATIYSGQDFRNWFRSCLHQKINERGGVGPTFEQDQRFRDLAHDAMIINEYTGERIRRPGINVLRDARMQRRYPHINNQPAEVA